VVKKKESKQSSLKTKYEDRVLIDRVIAESN
jgi:hypothetical protein